MIGRRQKIHGGWLLGALAASVLLVTGMAGAQGGSTLTVSQALSGTGLGAGGETYVPGGVLEVAITFETTGPDVVTALGFNIQVPTGWTYAGVGTTSPPDIRPQANATGRLDFGWIFAPEFPATFSFLLDIPVEAVGQGCLEGFSLYRYDAGELTSNTVQKCLAREGAVEGEGLAEGEGEGQAEGQAEGEGEGSPDGNPCGCNCAKNGYRLQDIDKWLGDFLLVGLSLAALGVWARRQ